MVIKALIQCIFLNPEVVLSGSCCFWVSEELVQVALLVSKVADLWSSHLKDSLAKFDGKSTEMWLSVPTSSGLEQAWGKKLPVKFANIHWSKGRTKIST